MCFALTIGLVGCDTEVTPGDSSSNIAGSTPTSSQNPDDSSTPNSSSTEEPTEQIVILDVAPNANFVLYATNKAEKDDKKAEFYDRTQEFFVGDDNAFIVKPEVQFLKIVDEMPVPFVPTEWNYVITLFRYTENNEYVELEGDDLETYTDSIDTVNATVDFSEEAIGEKFKISVYPEGVEDADIAEMTESIEVSVIDAYNVYSAKELACIENGSRNVAAENTVWAEFKAENNLTAEAKAGVILQTNINVTVDDVPSYFFYSEEEIGANDSDRETAIGSLKDRMSIYSRFFAAEETFAVIGNYFTLNCSSLPIVVRANDDIAVPGVAYESHSQLMNFRSSVDIAENNSYVEIKNINFIGNAPRVENTTMTGGVILTKSQNVATLAYNNIANNFFITYFPNATDKNYTMQKCKAYNGYSCFVYLYAAKDVHIDECNFESACGPVIIADHVDNSDGDRPSAVTVTNSELHSYVTGQEAWFNMYNATAVSAQIFAMNTAFTPFGRSFLKTRETASEKLQFMDFVAIFKSNENNGLTDGIKITGKYVQDGGVPMDFGTYMDPWTGFDNVEQNLMNMFIEQLSAQGAPMFMTSGGGMSFLNPSVGLMTLDQTFAPVQIMDPNDNVFKGEQLYLYYNRMGIVLNYFNAGETI